MRPLKRRGVTLVELLVSLTLLAIIGALIGAMMRGAVRTTSGAVAALGLQRLELGLGAFLRQELRDADTADVSWSSASQVTLLRPVGDGAVCGTNGAAVLVARTDWSGSRLPEAGHDQAAILIDPVAEGWDTVAIVAVTTAACPAGGAPALRLALATPVGGALIARVVEPTRLSVYRSGANDWFGLAPADGSMSVQPFAGPLHAGVSHFAITGGYLRALLAPAAGADTAIAIPLGTSP